MIGKSVGLIYGSTGEANHAQEQLQEILTTMSAMIVHDAIVAVSAVRSKIDDYGIVSDPQLSLQIESALRALGANAMREQLQSD